MTRDTQNSEEYLEKEWFASLESVFSYDVYNDLNEFLEAVKDGSSIKLDMIYDAAQTMINNQIEVSLKAAAERGDIQ